MKTTIVVITDDQIKELVEYRKFFKDPTYFKIFRMFYAFVLVTIGIFAIDPFEGVDADGKIKKHFSLI